MKEGVVRTTFVLPSEIAENLKRFIPNRKRSEFVAEAIDQHLYRMVYRQGLELSFGKWKDEDYQHLRTQDDVDRYIREMRSDEAWRINQEKEK